MIYILVRDAEDYDFDDVPIYASSSKEKVEKKHQELLEHHAFLKRYNQNCKREMDTFTASNPPPPYPNLSKLPTLPLVWNYSGWQNAYVVEYEIEMRKYNDKCNKFREGILNEIKKQHSFPKELEKLLHCIFFDMYDYTYSIKEVEGD